MTLKRPTRLNANTPKAKPRKLCKTPDAAKLAAAAQGATYEASRYHCRGPKGEHPISRVKPATPCPKSWTKDEAQIALQTSLRNGFVSEQWFDDYPRLIWYRDGEDTIYEARSEVGAPDRYHAYPVEATQVPKDLHW